MVIGDFGVMHGKFTYTPKAGDPSEKMSRFDFSAGRVSLFLGTSGRVGLEFEPSNLVQTTGGGFASTETWCCQAALPQLADLNGDGHLDLILSGYSSFVTWHAGNGKGDFGDTQILISSDNEIKFGHLGLHANFWDWDADGDLDLIASNIERGTVLYLNEGSATKPVFDSVPTQAVAAKSVVLGLDDEEGVPSSDELGSLYVRFSQTLMHDWDGDGLDDLMIAGTTKKDQQKIGWFRNIGKKGAPQFDTPQTLLSLQPKPYFKGVIRVVDGYEKRTLKGTLRIAVIDANSDGKEDLIVSDSWPEFLFRSGYIESNDELKDLHKELEQLSANQGDYETAKKRWAVQAKLREACLTAPIEERVHSVGMVWVLDRKTKIASGVALNSPNKSSVPSGVSDATGLKVGGKKSTKKKRKRSSPVQFSVMDTGSARDGGTVELTVDIDVRQGWYIYAPTGRNQSNGMVETVVTFELPEGFELAGDIILPPYHPKGMYEIYDGEDIRMTQSIKVNGAAPGEYTINGEVRYQTCNKEMCLPPATVKLVAKIVVK